MIPTATDLKVSHDQFTRAINELGEFVAIPSVSHPESPYFDMSTLTNAAQFVKTRLEDLDFTARAISVNGSAPFIIAERIVDVSKPTLLFYAHYDVQPVEEDKWETKPFVMVERDERLYGRGASDDKAGLIAILTALRVLKESNRELPVNIKVLSEGEEEYGSSNMGDLLKQEAKNLHADAMVVLDGANKDVATGTLTSSTRGIVNLTLEVKALKQPKHSGLACLAPCPALALAALVSSLQRPEEIPGFMDDAKTMSEKEREIYRQNTLTAEDYKAETGMLPVGDLRGESSLSVYERIAETPSLSIVNMNSGKPNGGNSIQDSASCTIGIRITAGQDPDKIGRVVKEYLESQKVLWNLPAEVTIKEGCRAWKADVTKPFSQMFMESLGENFKGKCVVPCGGALPLLYEFEKAFGENQPDIMVPGIEDPDTNAHSHNESQSKELLRNTINTIITFISKAGHFKKH